MKVFFHERFFEVYTGDPAASGGRLEPSHEMVSGQHDIIAPERAGEESIALIHTQDHIDSVRRSSKTYDMALLAAGATLDAARYTMESSEPAFALVRPPGHHASPSSAWGFCFFNNMAIAIEHLLSRREISSALILDIDLHHGDGTENAFHHRSEVAYLHPEGRDREQWLADCRRELDGAGARDIIAVSAGFDRHAGDWGDMLATDDYGTVGRWVREYADEHCSGRRFSVLEGGYDPDAMALALESLLAGMGQWDL